MKDNHMRNARLKPGYNVQTGVDSEYIVAEVYECGDCTDCLQKEKYTRARGNKRLYISKSFLEKRQESCGNFLSDTGILKKGDMIQKGSA